MSMRGLPAMPIARPRLCGWRPVAVRSGFSLIELTMVVVIIAIVGAIAVPRIGGSVSFRRAEAAAQQIKRDLEYARTYAMTHSTTQVFQCSNTTELQYALPGLRDPDRPDRGYKVSFDFEQWGLRVVSIDLGHDADADRLSIVFDMYGKPDYGGSMTIRVGNHTRTITIDDDTGHVSIAR